MDWDQSDSDGIPSYESEEEDFHQADFNHEGSERLNSKPISYQNKVQQKQEETPTQIFELTEDDIVCQICCKFALNAKNCSNQKCCQLFCQTCETNVKKNLQNKCPFCRVSPFDCKPSLYRLAINKMQLYCHLCQQKYIYEEEENHYKLNCTYFKQVQCLFCEKRLAQAEVVKHTKVEHPEKLDQIIERLYLNPKPICKANEVISKNKIYLEKLGKVPKLGTTGKFYCGGRLQTKCTCCNGYCGPSTGQNCTECMKLDIKRFGLCKGYLVNSSGNICWKSGEDFICGARISYQNQNCKEGFSCGSCRNMKKNIKRYEHLL